MPSIKTTTGLTIDLGWRIPDDFISDSSRNNTLMYNDTTYTHVITTTTNPDLMTLQSFRKNNSQNPEQQHEFSYSMASKSVQETLLKRFRSMRSTPLSGGLVGGYSPPLGGPATNQSYVDRRQVHQYYKLNQPLARAVARYVEWARKDHDTRSVVGLMNDREYIEEYLLDPSHADDAALLLGLEDSPGSSGTGSHR